MLLLRLLGLQLLLLLFPPLFFLPRGCPNLDLCSTANQRSSILLAILFTVLVFCGIGLDFEQVLSLTLCPSLLASDGDRKFANYGN